MTAQQLAQVLLALLLAMPPEARAPFAYVVEELRLVVEPKTVTVSVKAGEDLQAALDRAPEGAIVALEAGAEFSGNFVTSKGLTLTTGGVDIPDVRITPATAAAFAAIRSPNTAPAFSMLQGVSGVTLFGIRVLPNAGTGGTAIECGSFDETDVTRQPTTFIVDRVLVTGNPAGGSKRGIALHCSDATIIRNHVSGFKMDGQESQAIWMMNGPGPYVIEDNFLEAAGENIMIGGDDPRIVDLVPADIDIYGNTVSKPLAWRTERWDQRNLIEVKNGRRVSIRKNIIEGSWVKNQTGWAIMLTPRNQYGRAPQSVLEDIVIEDNVIRNVSSGINLLGEDDERSSQRTRGVVIRNNLIQTNRAQLGGDGRALMLGRAPQSVTVDHNTFVADGSSPVYTYAGGSVTVSPDFTFTNNVFRANNYGFNGPPGQGTRTLTAYYPGARFAGNVIAGAPNSYPVGNFLPTLAQFAAVLGTDGRLLATAPYTATDGTAPGVDWARLPR